MTARNLKPVESGEPEVPEGFVKLGTAMSKGTSRGGLPIFEGPDKLILYCPRSFAAQVEGVGFCEVFIKPKEI